MRWRSSAAGDEPIGVTGVKFNTMPTLAPGTAARIRSIARPWPTRRWWLVARQSRSEVRPGRVLAGEIAVVGDDERFVQRHPVGDPVAEPRRDHVGVVGECFGGCSDGPPALVLERLREVPVVQRREGPNAGREQRVDQAVVEVETTRVDLPPALRHDARPGDREPIGVEVEASHRARCPRRNGGSGHTRRRRRCRR